MDFYDKIYLNTLHSLEQPAYADSWPVNAKKIYQILILVNQNNTRLKVESIMVIISPFWSLCGEHLMIIRILYRVGNSPSHYGAK